MTSDVLALIPVVGFVLLGGRAVLRFAYSERVRERRTMRRTKLTAVAQISGGFGKVMGRVQSKEPLYAPVSGRPCVAWVVTVRQREILNHNRGLWETWFQTSDAQRFWIEDDSGRARIEPKPTFAIFDPAPVRVKFAVDEGTHATLEAVLAERERDGTRDSLMAVLSRRHLRIIETCVLADQSVVVAGTCELAADEDGQGQRGSYREMPRIVVVRGDESNPVLLQARPGYFGLWFT